MVPTRSAVLDGVVDQYRTAYQALGLFGPDQCEPNSFEELDYEGKVLVLSPDTLKESYRRTSRMSGSYDDIINLPHPTSAKHPRMPISDRAAIFSPFAALTGHAAAIQETARLTDQRMELDEDTRAMLDLKQQILADRIAEQPEVSVVWFRPDERKAGGQYVTTVGQLKKVDDIERVLRFDDGTTIPLDDVLELQSDCFRGIFQEG